MLRVIAGILVVFGLACSSSRGPRTFDAGVEAPMCSCTNVDCGDDGCGNSCGTCGDGMSCQSGECVASCDAQPIFDRSCALAGCHDSVTAPAGLDLSTVGTGAALIGRPSGSADVGGACTGVAPIVDPGAPENSLILLKLSGAPPCGSAMPLVGMLQPGERECIEGWVNAAVR